MSVLEETAELQLQSRAGSRSQGAAIFCFPSFQAIWATFCNAAVWVIRRFSMPVALFLTIIGTSTVMTGGHYVTEVAGGVAIAGLSLFSASRYTRMNKFQRQPLRGVSL